MAVRNLPQGGNISKRQRGVAGNIGGGESDSEQLQPSGREHLCGGPAWHGEPDPNSATAGLATVHQEAGAARPGPRRDTSKGQVRRIEKEGEADGAFVATRVNFYDDRPALAGFDHGIHDTYCRGTRGPSRGP